MATPPLKWAGAKRFLAPSILERLPGRIRVYREPFVGAGAVFFALEEEGRLKDATEIALSDSNSELIHCHKTIRDACGDLIRTLRNGTYLYEDETYYRIRAQKPAEMPDVERAARFIYLNKTCYNGLYRENRQKQFNVPMGRYKNPTICNEPALGAASSALRYTHLDAMDFEKAMDLADSGDVVYCDPPYAAMDKEFTRFCGDGFGEKEQIRLRDAAVRCKQRGAIVLLSNADLPVVHELYADFQREIVTAPRSINSKGGARGTIREVLIS